MEVIKTDVLIVGSGVSGLWAHYKLSSLGLSILSIDRGPVGGVQSLASQGMIHGGQRYTLLGQETDHSRHISMMPQRWEEEFTGALSNVKKQSRCQYMWTPGSLLSKVTGFLASKAMNSSVEKVVKADWPEVFREQKNFSGNVYRMDEVVVDSSSLAKELRAHSSGYFKRAELFSINFKNDDRQVVDHVVVKNSDTGDEYSIKAQAYLFLAGTGNEIFCQSAFPNEDKTQRRPLKQLLVRGPRHHFFGHCIGTDARPRATVSSYDNQDDQGQTKIWYLGGKVAEDALGKTDSEAFRSAAKEMNSLFPQYDFSKFEWSSLEVDRAEPKATSGFFHTRPEQLSIKNASTIWPMKLTYAPVVGDKVYEWVRGLDLRPTDGEGCESLPDNSQGDLPWNHMNWQGVMD